MTQDCLLFCNAVMFCAGHGKGVRLPSKQVGRMLLDDGAGSKWHDYRHYKTYFRYFLIFVLGMATFGNSINGSFVFDDSEAIINNKDVTSSKSIYALFVHDFWGSNISSALSHKSYRPLVVLSFKFNYWIFNRLDATSYHAVNILLYGIACTLFLKFFTLVFDKMDNRNHETSLLPIMSALLFTLHPLHAENVSAIVGRADLMCSIFFLLAFFSYVKFVDTTVNFCWKMTYLCFFVLCSICSLLSKEHGITVFGICFVHELVLGNKFSSYPFTERLKKVASSRDVLLRLSMLIVLSVTFLILRLLVMGSEIPHFQEFDNPHSFVENPFFRVLNYNYLYFINAWILINPWWLCFDWSMGCIPVINSVSDWRLLLVIFLNCTVIAVLLYCFMKKEAKDKNLVVISVSIIIIPFLPSSNCFFKVGFVIAERNLFLSSAGVCMLVVAGMDRFRCRFKKLVSILFLLLLMIYFKRSVQRSSHWLDEETLFSTGTQVCPKNAKVHYNIAKIAADKGFLSMAFKRYHMAIKLAPSYDQALNNLGNLYKEQGNFTLAEEYLWKALSVRPDFAAAWMNLGIAQGSLKKFKMAEISYRTALSHRAKYPDCHYNLGNLYLEQGDHASALLAWRNATLQNVHHVAAWTNMLILLDNLGLFQDIDIIARIALEHNPTESSLYFNYANALGKMGRYEESEKNFLLAIKYQERTANYHSNLGVLYHRWHKLDKAEHHYKIAMKLDPNNDHLLKNFKLLQS